MGKNMNRVWIIEFSPVTGQGKGHWYPVRNWENCGIPPFRLKREAMDRAKYFRSKATPRYRVVRYESRGAFYG